MAPPIDPSWVDFRTKDDRSLGDLSGSKCHLLVFFRHSGCTFCREAVDDIAKVRPQLLDDGAEAILVHHGDEHRFLRLLRDTGLEACPRVHDPERKLYHAFGLTDARLDQWLSPGSMLRSVEAILAGHGWAFPDGSSLQMPGLFAIHDRKVLVSYYHRNVSDRPDYLAVAREAMKRIEAPPRKAKAAAR
ncbi:MAG: redoxin domain-containing protein [Candidatus Sumerlaeia bacterium]|nr:redoxin domain-containing protein [Candidatus Sumerlaeia bacterium]